MNSTLAKKVPNDEMYPKSTLFHEITCLELSGDNYRTIYAFSLKTHFGIKY